MVFLLILFYLNLPIEKDTKQAKNQSQVDLIFENKYRKRKFISCKTSN